MIRFRSTRVFVLMAGLLWAAAAGAVTPGAGLLGQGDSAWGLPGTPPSAATPAAGVPGVLAGRREWSRVRRWAYQLQKPDLAALAAIPADLLVIDYSRDGTAAGALTRSEIEGLQRAGKRVVAYLSIGEAESYRYYWMKGWRTGRPAWLGTENPDWKGNFTVRFWDPDWQALLMGSSGAYLDRILDAGFDGIYLDIVEGYSRFPDRPGARQEMIDLVGRLAGYARALAGADFGVFPQNALELVEDPGYLGLITGVGKEETYFFPGDKPNEAADQAEEEGWLDRVVAAGKLALTVDYCRQPGNVQTVFARAQARGYVPYAAGRELDQLGDLAP